MSDDLKRKKSDYLLELALEEQLENDGEMQAYQSGNERPHEFSDEHNRKIKDILKRAEREENKKKYRRKRLQAPAFKELKLPCSSSDEPAKIAAYIKDKCMDIDALIEKKQTAINKREEYKKSLIYYTVTGKIDCRNEVM